jgi:hypothetical protein
LADEFLPLIWPLYSPFVFAPTFVQAVLPNDQEVLSQAVVPLLAPQQPRPFLATNCACDDMLSSACSCRLDRSSAGGAWVEVQQHRTYLMVAEEAYACAGRPPSSHLSC